MSFSTGLVRALVVDRNDPDQLGRVKLSFPSLGEQGKQIQSEWCRVIRPLAFESSGDWYLPEVGSEVVVGFEGGDLGFPVVLGCVFGENSKPPVTGRPGDANQDEKNTLRAMKTRSGHTLIFDDAEGKEAVILKDKAENTFTLDSAEKSIQLKSVQGHALALNEKGIELKSKKGHSVVMSENGVTIETSGGDKLILEEGKIQIQAASKIEIGKDASKSIAIGEEIMQAFNNHTHMYMATMSAGVTQPPLVPMTPAVMTQKVKVSP